MLHPFIYSPKLKIMDTKTISPAEFQSTLAGFIGTFKYHIHQLFKLSINLTDGCDYVRREARAYWLFDAILSHQLTSTVNKQPFQVWRLKKQEDDTWSLICEDGNKNILATQRIEFSDFLIDEITIWLVNGVAMLPTEY